MYLQVLCNWQVFWQNFGNFCQNLGFSAQIGNLEIFGISQELGIFK